MTMQFREAVLPSMKIVKYSDVPYTILSMNEICFDSASIKLRRIRDRRRFLRCFSGNCGATPGASYACHPFLNGLTSMIVTGTIALA